jgi:glyoxylase-like metal-dependent hydrolase (beta-lactamase superfamily II)
VKVEWVTVGPFQENSYLVSDPATRRGVLVDPGDEPSRIVRMVRAARVDIEAIWLTHAHIDHIGAVAAMRREWKVPVLLHDADLVLYQRAAQQAAFYGLELDQPGDPDGSLADGAVLSVGQSRVTVRHTPGHSPGHVVFVADRVMIGGDLLFAGSIGRTDLPLSSPEAMEASLALIATFDPEIAVYPGHGPPTNIATELATNPFLASVRTSI